MSNNQLTVPRESRCIGCMLCAVKASLIKSGSVDLKNSFIKVVKKNKKYVVLIDRGEYTAYKEIVDICPRNCFDIEKVSTNQ